ncbi:MAG: DUF1428 domain-containing protein [Vibrio sp.]
MSYVDCMLAAVPSDNKAQYIQHARITGAIFKEYGALAIVENWGDEIPEGDVTSLIKAVKAKPNETVALSWIIWPSKDVRDKAWQAVMEDPRMMDTSNPMPFDGQRLIHGGFESILQL